MMTDFPIRGLQYGLAGLLAVSTSVLSQEDTVADPEAGARLATQCAACHGPAGISVGNEYPNLAAQKPDYLSSQLEAFKSGDRENPLMNAIAAALSTEDMANLAAHFSGLPGASPGESAERVSDLDGSLPAFPGEYSKGFTRYQRIDFPDRGQVRYYWANDSALASAKAGNDFDTDAYLLVEIYGAKTDANGEPITGEDGQLVQTDLAAFTAMQKGEKWGDDVPSIYENGNWRYAVFSAAGDHQDNVNEAPCMACHKPLTDTDYSFTYETLQQYAKSN